MSLRKPATAIALAAAEEASLIVWRHRLPIIGYEYPRENNKDYGQDLLARLYADREISQDFAGREGAIYWGKNPRESAYPSWAAEWLPYGLQIDQARHPTKMDIGWYNLNVGQAILHLDRYLAETGPGGKSEGDPLHLSQYANNKGRFAADIASMDGNGARWKIVGRELCLQKLSDSAAVAGR
jgi:hypothetical protein